MSSTGPALAKVQGPALVYGDMPRPPSMTGVRRPQSATVEFEVCVSARAVGESQVCVEITPAGLSHARRALRVSCEGVVRDSDDDTLALRERTLLSRVSSAMMKTPPNLVNGW